MLAQELAHLAAEIKTHGQAEVSLLFTAKIITVHLLYNQKVAGRVTIEHDDFFKNPGLAISEAVKLVISCITDADSATIN